MIVFSVFAFLIIVGIVVAFGVIVNVMNVVVPIVIALITLLFICLYIGKCKENPAYWIAIPIILIIAAGGCAGYVIHQNNREVNLYVAKENCTYHKDDVDSLQAKDYTEIEPGTVIAECGDTYYFQDANGTFIEVGVNTLMGIKNKELQKTITYKEFKDSYTIKELDE